MKPCLPEDGVALAAAVGGTFGIGVTFTSTVAVSVAPLSSVTVSVAVWMPTALYV